MYIYMHIYIYIYMHIMYIYIYIYICIYIGFGGYSFMDSWVCHKPYRNPKPQALQPLNPKASAPREGDPNPNKKPPKPNTLNPEP